MNSDASERDYLVLARKYRPQHFRDLAGQEHVTETLRNAIASGRIAHAFLFTGIRGVGKTTAARLLAKALNCERSAEPTPDPCDECSNCQEIRDSRSVDVAEIDGASNRGIDSIRELTDNVRYLPIKSRFRVYIIDEAHMVTREGFNALLKTLEEPPAHVKFIFATTAVEKFPETIVSRCQRYDFKRIPLARIKHELERIADKERVELTDAAFYAIAREGQGSMRDAESLLERLIAFSDRTIDDARVGEILGVADRSTLVAAAEAVLSHDAKGALEIVDRVYESGRDLERFSRDLLEHWRNLVVTKLGADASVLVDVPPDEIGEYRRQAALRDLGELQRLFRIARLGDEELGRSSVPRMVLEMTIVRLATAEPMLPIDEVLGRLDEIERGLGRSPEPSARAAPLASPRPRIPPSTTATGAAGRDGSPADERSSRTAPRASEDAPGAGDPRWEELLAFVQQKKPSLYFNLSHARWLGGGAGSLVLGVAKEKFRNELASRTTLTLLEELASAFYGQPTRIRVEAVTADVNPPPPAPSASDMLEHPSVKAAVEILGGEVREVRPRR
ncbi:MAG TPA: DNA polymerase III subunit gamma/tau [Candidatus Binatia bacterium]|nr:DNA polymerase III subunit gamma/tau [Candidatus Binatia bacterium]